MVVLFILTFVQPHIGVRAALGAGVLRLRRLLLVETLALTFMGAVLGVIVAIGGMGLLALPQTSLAKSSRTAKNDPQTILNVAATAEVYAWALIASAAWLRRRARAMPRSLVLILARHQGHDVAGALCLRGGDTLYGRYWGSTLDASMPGLHFETCYYQGIEYCLREGLRVFEPGAQGEHKLARGFLPTFVRSRHYIADPGFAAALAPWCAEEAKSIQAYAATLARHSPFRDEGAGPPA